MQGIGSEGMREDNLPSLSNRMHTQLCIPHVHRSRAQRGTEHRPNGAATRRVVPDNKQLQRHAGRAGNLLRQDDAGRVGCVPSISINLECICLVGTSPSLTLAHQTNGRVQAGCERWCQSRIP